MKFLHHNTIPARVPSLLNRLELLLIAAMAILLPFDHWFFGKLVNPAPMRVLGFVLTGVWLLQYVTRQRRFKPEVWHLFVLAFLADCFFSAIASPVFFNSDIDNYRYKLVATSKIVAAMLFFVLACQMLTREKLLYFLHIHLVTGSTICTVSLVLYFLHLYGIWQNNFALWVDQDINNFVRIQGVSFEPQRFGAYMLTLLPFFLSKDLRSEIGWPCNRLDPLILMIMLATTFLSYAVSTYLVLPIMMLFLFGTSKAKLRQLVWILTGCMAMAAILLLIPAVRDATIEIITVKMRGQSMATRQHNWGIAFLEFAVYPWTGVGPEGYSHFYSLFDKSVRNPTPSSHPPHGLFFGLLANQGLPGVIAFFSMITAFAVSLIRRLLAMRTSRNLAYTLSVIALVHLMVQFTIWLPWSLNQWLYMAMAWAAVSAYQTRTGESAT